MKLKETLKVLLMFSLVIGVLASGYLWGRHLEEKEDSNLGGPEGTLVFTIYATPEDSRLEMTVGAYGESGRLFNYDLVGGSFPLTTTVSVPSEAYNVSIFFPSVKSIYCEVVWNPSEGQGETYSQSDTWEGPAIPQCNWRRHYSNQR